MRAQSNGPFPFGLASNREIYREFIDWIGSTWIGLIPLIEAR
jgi:hypothetical protein